jgi:hypothetical protein
MATIISFPVSSAADRLTPWKEFVSWCTRLVGETPLFNALCCLDNSEVENHSLDRSIRREIRSSMCTHYSHMAFDAAGDHDGVLTAIQDVYQTEGYDLGGESRNAATVPFGAARQSLPMVVRASVDHRLQVYPRFAAACALALRARLGILSKTDANLLLVQREYLIICRRRGVRQHDIVSHQLHVMNAVFNEGVLDRVALTRRRIPRWLRWAYPSETGEPSLAVC